MAKTAKLKNAIPKTVTVEGYSVFDDIKDVTFNGRDEEDCVVGLKVFKDRAFIEGLRNHVPVSEQGILAKITFTVEVL